MIVTHSSNIMCHNKIISFFSCYVPPNVNYSLDQSFNIFDKLLKMSSNYTIICGDFNAHSPVWGDHRNDSKGKCIVNLLDKTNLCNLNTGLPTRFRHSFEPSALISLSRLPTWLLIVNGPRLMTLSAVIMFQSLLISTRSHKYHILIGILVGCIHLRILMFKITK